MRGIVRVSALCLAVPLAMVVAAPPAEAARPRTIPALREWMDAAGSYTFVTASRIVLSSAHASALSTDGVGPGR